jgi:hypothetical protein
MTVKTQHDLLFMAALAKPDPVLRLRDVVKELLTQGQEREEVLDELEHLRDALGRAGQEKTGDAVLDVMDFVVGWASPHMKV